MRNYLGYSIIGGILFLGTTLLVLNFSNLGIHKDLWDAISGNSTFKGSVRASFWIGVLTGGVSSIILRKSTNRRIYVWILIIMTMVFTEFVIYTLIN